MNKKIKVIELLNKIASGEYPKRFKYNNKIYEYKRTVNGTGYVTENDDWFNYVTENDDWFNSDIFIDEWENLNEEIEILEDNTEEKEELPDDDYSIKENRDKINEIIRYIKRKDKNK